MITETLSEGLGMTQRQLPSRRVAYLLKRFPRLSETFILHEILELERQGLDLHLFSFRNPDEEIVHADVSRVRAPVTYFPAGWRGTWAMLRAHLARGRRPRSASTASITESPSASSAPRAAPLPVPALPVTPRPSSPSGGWWRRRGIPISSTPAGC